VIDDILDFSKIEAGKLASRHRLRPVAVVEEVAVLLAGQAQDKGLELTCSLDPRLPQMVAETASGSAGAHQPGRQRGQFTETVRCRRRQSPAASGTRPCCSSGSGHRGVGMDPNRLEHMFEGFTQADSTTTALRRHRPRLGISRRSSN
jgi:signal transduction histidine kinase